MVTMQCHIAARTNTAVLDLAWVEKCSVNRGCDWSRNYELLLVHGTFVLMTGFWCKHVLYPNRPLSKESSCCNYLNCNREAAGKTTGPAWL